MQASTIIISVDYEDGNPATYRGIELSVDKNKTRTFYNSEQTPNDDLENAITCIKTDFENWEDIYIMTSSSVDHFVMEGGVLDI